MTFYHYSSYFIHTIRYLLRYNSNILKLENIGVVSKQISDGMNEIRGVMIESHLREGNQKIGEDLEYGQSVTDACIHFEDTKQCLSELSSAVQARRSKS